MLCIAGVAETAPFVPERDSVVLERLPRLAMAGSKPAAFQPGVANAPSLDEAVRRATGHIEAARRDSDPRQLGRAQAVLAPWWDQATPPIPVMLLRATIRQSNHEFSKARADLERITSREPSNAQAWLTLATVQQVTGDHAAARASCQALAKLAEPLVHASCIAAADGANGRAAAALARLDGVLQQAPRTSPGVMAWTLSLRGELAERAGIAPIAEESFRAALALDPGDAYARAAYADFLLDQGRPAEVLPLVAANLGADALMLRHVLAATVMRDPSAETGARWLAARYTASRARGDRVHLREEARFTLHVQRDSQRALQLALENFEVQKEPADARLVLEAALAAGKPEAARHTAQWVRDTRLEGGRLQELQKRIPA